MVHAAAFLACFWGNWDSQYSPSLPEICSPNLTKCAEQHSFASFWGSNEFQRTYSITGRYGRFSISILKFNSTASTQSHEHVSSRARNVRNSPPPPTKKQQKHVYLIQTFNAVKTVLPLPRCKIQGLPCQRDFQAPFKIKWYLVTTANWNVSCFPDVSSSCFLHRLKSFTYRKNLMFLNCLQRTSGVA